MIELFRSDQLLVRCLPQADTSRWVITFDNYGIGHGFDRMGFGEEFLAQSGISAIHVMGVREDWYQYPEMAEAMAAVRLAVAGAERVMTYGSSMGGYAALRFADWAGANAVLALSPQYSNDPQLVPFESRWTQDASRIQWLPELQGPLRCQARAVVAFDPQMEDLRHADMIASDTSIDMIRLPYSGHPSTSALAEMGLLGHLALQTLDGSLDVASFTRQAHERRRHSPNYMANLAMSLHLKPRHAAKALAIAKMAVRSAPGHATSVSILAQIQSAQGLHEEALATLSTLEAKLGESMVFLVPYANALLAAGRYDQALAIASDVVSRPPPMAHLLAWKGHMHWKNNQHEEALSDVRKAHALDPINPAFKRMLSLYEERMRWDVALLKRFCGWVSSTIKWIKGQG